MDDTQVKVLGGLWRNVNQVHSAAMRYGWTVDAYRTAMLATLTGEPATPAPDSEKLREALEAGRTFLAKANSAWACGEPLHRVKTMLDAADAFQAALDRVPGASL